jgi:hypothetical protein
MAVGDKIQLAMKSEVTAVNSSVTTLNTTVNDPATGLVLRVTNLEAGGGPGMTPQQVADLAACVADKHTHTNKAVLDLVQEAYTTAEKTKLGNLTDNFKGLFADAAARNAAVATPLTGNYVLQEDTNTVWYYNGSSWLNTGVTSAGDMLKAVYDPTSKNADAFNMASMVETATKKVMTEVERDKLKFYRGHATDATTMNALADLAEGHYCTRQDTKTVWLYDGTAWGNTSSATGSSEQLVVGTYKQTAKQSIPNNVATKVTGFTAVNASATWDSANSRFAITKAGIYRVRGRVSYDGNATGIRQAFIQRNGVTVTTAASAPVDVNTITIHVEETMGLAVGDLIDLHTFQTSGGSLQTSVTVSGHFSEIEIIQLPTATTVPAASSASVGDTKFSYRTADHDGWYILDGRSVTTLSGSAQAAAATLGWNSIIPNTRGMFALAASPTALSGSIGGSNTIARSALPNFTLTGNTGNESTSHVHVVNAFNASGTTSNTPATNSTETNVIAFSPARTVISDNGAALGGTTDNSYMALAGADRAIVSSDTSHTHSITMTIPTHTSQANSPGHTHSYTTPSINGGVTQTAHLPAYSAKTEFVYLGL